MATPIETVGWGVSQSAGQFSATALQMFWAAHAATPGSTGEDGDDPVIIETGDDVAGADQQAGCFTHVTHQAVHLGSTEQFLDTVMPIDRDAQE